MHWTRIENLEKNTLSVEKVRVWDGALTTVQDEEGRMSREDEHGLIV